MVVAGWSLGHQGLMPCGRGCRTETIAQRRAMPGSSAMPMPSAHSRLPSYDGSMGRQRLTSHGQKERGPMRIIVFGNGTIGAALQALLRDIGHDVMGVGRTSGEARADLTDIAGLRAFFADIAPFDAVACAAGDVFPASLERATDEQWSKSIAAKGMGQINLVRAALPAYRRARLLHAYLRRADRRSDFRRHHRHERQSSCRGLRERCRRRNAARHPHQLREPPPSCRNPRPTTRGFRDSHRSLRLRSVAAICARYRRR